MPRGNGSGPGGQGPRTGQGSLTRYQYELREMPMLELPSIRFVVGRGY
jgi:hypothetical protein